MIVLRLFLHKLGSYWVFLTQAYLQTCACHCLQLAALNMLAVMFMQVRAKALKAVCLYIFLTSVTYTLAHAHTLGENPHLQKMTHSYIRLKRGSYCDKQFVTCLTCVTTQPQVAHTPLQTPMIAHADSEHESPNTNTKHCLTLCWPTNFLFLPHVS